MRMMTGRKVGQECAATELLWNANANNDDKGSICVRVHRNVRLSIDNGLCDQTLIAITAQITTMRQGKEHSIICSADGIDYLHNPATMGLKEKTRSGIYPNAHQEYLRNERANRTQHHDIIDIPISSNAIFESTKLERVPVT